MSAPTDVPRTRTVCYVQEDVEPAPPPTEGDAAAVMLDEKFSPSSPTVYDTLSDRKPSLSTLASAVGPLPEGCSYGYLPKDDIGAEERVIWVDFPAGSRENPFYFAPLRKLGITCVAVFYTLLSAYTTSAFSISAGSMCEDLGCSTLEVEAGIALYCWGFALAPLFLAPLSEELGRKWTYISAVIVFWIFHLMMTLGQNTTTILVSRFILGLAGSLGATLVGGTISDIFVPSQRGVPMAVFGFAAIFGTGLGGATMVFVEVDQRLRWRWVWWIQFIVVGVFIPIVALVMVETRDTVILRRKAKNYRKVRGMSDGARYLARSEVTKVRFAVAMRESLLRPLLFLVTEPVVMFFSAWIGLGVSSCLTPCIRASADLAVGRVLHADRRPSVHVPQHVRLLDPRRRPDVLGAVRRRHPRPGDQLAPGEGVPAAGAEARHRGAAVRAHGRGDPVLRRVFHHGFYVGARRALDRAARRRRRPARGNNVDLHYIFYFP